MSFKLAIALAFVATAAWPLPAPALDLRVEADPTAQMQKTRKNDQQDRETACSCCEACKAAKKEIRGKEEGRPAENGCRDCCERCGNSDSVDPTKKPPEIILK